MSKQDTHFFNMFSLVIGILVAVAIILFTVSRVVANNTQARHVFAEREYLVSVDERVRPFVRVAVAGQDNTALAIKETSIAPPPAAMAVPTSGTEVYDQACSACHAQGIAGAPKAGDKGLWAPRIAKGTPTLYQHAIQGFQGSAGIMPPKGGRADISDDLIRQAVDHMVEISR